MSAPLLGSLFSGYGGLDMAVCEVLGTEVAWHCQYEPPDKDGRPDRNQYAARVLAHRWPGVPNLGDVTRIDWADVPPVRIVVGGSPCQDVSHAGLGAGMAEGTRSGLWGCMAEAVAVLRPELVFLENVGGLLSAKADRGVGAGDADVEAAGEHALRALGRVLGDLAGLGFDARWCRVRASDVGAAHQRARVFVLAWPADTEGEGREGPRIPGRPAVHGADAADADRVGGERDRARRTGRDEPAPHGQPAADAARVGAGEPADQAVALADGRAARAVPGRRGRGTPPDTAGDGRQQGRPEPAGQQRGLGVAECGGAAGDGGGRDWGPYAAAVQRWETVLGRPAPAPVDHCGRLSPRLVEWLMGLPEGHVTGVPGIPRTAQLKALGNGVVPQQAAHALRCLLTDPAERRAVA